MSGGTPRYLPDHTLEGDALAIELGSDYVDVDLGATKDGHLAETRWRASGLGRPYRFTTTNLEAATGRLIAHLKRSDAT